MAGVEFLTPENTPSLGWDLLQWYEACLRVPSGPDYGKPLVLTDEQARFIVRLYAVDKRGRFPHRRAALRRMKGWGKSPVLAAWAIGEFAGDVQFDGWDADGYPVGRPWPTPWIQIAACSEDQTDNTYSALYAMLSDSPALDDLGIDLGLTKAFLKDRPKCVIEPVTSAAGSREGQPITAAVLDETHLWLKSNGGRRLAATLRRNVGKMGGRTVESTNAFVPGEGSVAEDSHKAWENGEAGLLYDSVEGPWVEDLGDKRALRKAVKVARGDSVWVDVERRVADIQDSATDPADARRFQLNQLVKGEHAAVDPHRHKFLAHPEIDVPDGTRIGVGFDGSISNDATALRGCTIDGHRFTVAVWERPPGAPKDWRIPRLEVEAKVAETFERYDVGRMLCDPAKWHTEIEEWAARWNTGTAEEAVVLVFDTNSTKRMSAACDRYLTAIREGTSTHDGDETATRHILAMAKKKVRVTDDDDDGRTKYVFVKTDTRKIDAGIADVLALEAAMTMPEPVAPQPFFASWGSR